MLTGTNFRQTCWNFLRFRCPQTPPHQSPMYSVFTWKRIFSSYQNYKIQEIASLCPIPPSPPHELRICPWLNAHNPPLRKQNSFVCGGYVIHATYDSASSVALIHVHLHCFFRVYHIFMGKVLKCSNSNLPHYNYLKVILWILLQCECVTLSHNFVYSICKK